MESSLESGSIFPSVLALPMEFIFEIGTSICISIDEFLETISMLIAIIELSLVAVHFIILIVYLSDSISEA